LAESEEEVREYYRTREPKGICYMKMKAEWINPNHPHPDRTCDAIERIRN